MTNSLLRTLRKIYKNKIAMTIITIIVIITAIIQYTSFVANKYTHSTPENAIRSFVYDEYEGMWGKMASWKLLLIEVEQVYDVPAEFSTYGDEIYYRIIPKKIHSRLHNHIGGIFKLRKIDKHNYIVEYLGYF